MICRNKIHPAKENWIHADKDKPNEDYLALSPIAQTHRRVASPTLRHLRPPLYYLLKITLTMISNRCKTLWTQSSRSGLDGLGKKRMLLGSDISLQRRYLVAYHLSRHNTCLQPLKLSRAIHGKREYWDRSLFPVLANAKETLGMEHGNLGMNWDPKLQCWHHSLIRDLMKSSHNVLAHLWLCHDHDP